MTLGRPPFDPVQRPSASRRSLKPQERVRLPREHRWGGQEALGRSPTASQCLRGHHGARSPKTEPGALVTAAGEGAGQQSQVTGGLGWVLYLSRRGLFRGPLGENPDCTELCKFHTLALETSFRKVDKWLF